MFRFSGSIILGRARARARARAANLRAVSTESLDHTAPICPGTRRTYILDGLNALSFIHSVFA